MSSGAGRGYAYIAASILVAATDGSTSGVVFSEGTMNANATISWSVQEAFPYNGEGSDVPTFALDSAGNPWIAIDSSDGNCRHIEVFKDTGGLWSQVFDVGGLVNYARPILLPLASDKMALEILTETPVTRQLILYVSADDGGSWSSPLTRPSDEMLTFSAVSTGNDVYTVTADTSGNVLLWSYAFGNASFGGPTKLATWGKTGEGDASISTYGASLFAVYSSSTAVYCISSSDSGGSWTPATEISGAENKIQTDSLGTSPTSNGVFDVVWTAQDYAGGTSFDVRFAQVSLGG